MNKRGGLVDEVTPEMIIAILCVIVIVVVAVTAIKSVDMKFGDGYCRFKSSIMKIMPSGVKAMLSGVLSCSWQNENADGNDWDKCPEMEAKYKACKDQECANDVNKDCAAYQIAKLAERCWWRYLSGNMEAPEVHQDLECYTIHTADFSGTVDGVRVKEFIDSSKMNRAKFEMKTSTHFGSDCQASSNRDYNLFDRAPIDKNSQRLIFIC